MYALFNSETGIFKDNGAIKYGPDENGAMSLQIGMAGDVETAEFFEKFANKADAIWGETAKGFKESLSTLTNRTGEQEAPKENDITKNEEVKRTDPLSFRTSDNQEFIFAMDRNNDGKFSGASDFVGGDANSWLDDLKSFDLNNDNKLTDEELSQLKLLGVEFNDNVERTETASTTTVNYTLQSAQSLGISEIDLSQIDASKVNSSTGKVDVNNSEIFNDKFSFTMNGQTIEASRKDETGAYMDAVYGDAKGKNFEIGFTSSEINNIVDESSAEFNSKNETFEKFMQDSATVLNSATIAAVNRELYNQALNRIQDNQNAQILRAENKAQVNANAKNWGTLQKEIQSIANQKGVSVDMTQAHGFYVQNGSLSAEQIVDKCIELKENLENDESEKVKLQDEAWSTVLEGYKKGVSITLDEATELLNSGKSKDEIIEQYKEELFGK